MSALKQDHYVYPVTRVHNHEQGLLTGQDIERLLSAEGMGECLRLLSGKGWGPPSAPPENPEALLDYETERTWSLLEELTQNLDLFNVLRVGIDFHNLKAAVKVIHAGEDDAQAGGDYFRRHGAVPLEAIVDAARLHDFCSLPPALAEAGARAYEVLAHTASGQECDMLIDRAALVEMQALARSTASPLLNFYADLTADVANIKSAVRASRMKRDWDFLMRAVAPAGSLSRPRLIEAALSGERAVCDYLLETGYEAAVPALRRSVAAFETWCGNLLMAHIRPLRFTHGGLEPMVAYLLWRENEIAMVRLIFSAKINRLEEGALRERLRELYV